MNLTSLIAGYREHARELRHHLHAIPEVGYEEVKTAALIRKELSRLGIAFTAGVAGAPTATIALIGDASRPCVALRADIDALPIVEQTGAAYASTHPGRMHACGHDGHTAMLLTAAAVLRDVQDELPVCVKLLWQPAEEGGAGAEPLIAAGALDGRLGPKVQAIFGLHGWPSIPLGVLATKPGALLAATDNFTITFKGKGVHGAYPHAGRDPIVAAAEAVASLQQIVSREMDPTEPAVVTVGKFSAGTAVNIIPDTAVFEGTARTLSAAARKQVRDAMRRRCEGVAASHRCQVQMEWREGYPPLINDAHMAAFAAKSIRAALGDAAFQPVERPSMGGEDFAYYLQHVPGCFLLLGLQPTGAAAVHPMHSDHFDFNDDALTSGVSALVQLASDFRPSV